MIIGTQIIIAIALWCGPPIDSKGQRNITVDKCRHELYQCIKKYRKSRYLPEEICFFKEKIK